LKLFLKKNGYNLLPAGQSDLEILSKIDNGKIVECDIKQPRNVELHRLFFAMLRIAFDNWQRQPSYKSIDELLIALKYEVGFVEKSFLFNKKIVSIPRSISFTETDNIEFKEFFNKCSYVLSDHLGMHVMDLLNESEKNK